MRHIKNKILLIKAIATEILIDKMNMNSVVFLIQQEARKGKKELFNYEFKRKYLYPYSEELEKDLLQLINEGYIISREQKYEATEKGKDFVRNTQRRYFQYEIDTFLKYQLYVNKDKNFFKLTDKINAEYQILKTKEDGIIVKIEEFFEEEKQESIKEEERKNKIEKKLLIQNDDILMEKLKLFKENKIQKETKEIEEA